MGASSFRRQAIFAEYYACIRIDHAIAVPVVASPGLVMSYVNRTAAAMRFESWRKRRVAPPLALPEPH